jgi:hypothetical protein
MQSIGVNILEHFIQKLTLIEIIDLFMNYNELYSHKPNTVTHSLSRVVVPATLTQHLCQRSFYKNFVKFINSKKNVFKIVLIIVNINNDENQKMAKT